MIDGAVGVAAFDFDGTLVAGDSFTPFLLALCGWARLSQTLATSLTTTFVANGYRLDRDATKADVVARLLSGYPAERVASEGLEFGARLAKRVRPLMRAQVDWHRAQGHRLLLVSASPEVYLEPLGCHLGFHAILGTRLEVGSDGRLSGRLEGANCRGQEKERRVRDWLDANVADRRVEMWAYGDSAGDRELLAMADHPLLLSRWDHMRRRLAGSSVTA